MAKKRLEKMKPIPVITTKEKKAPAYRKKLEQENSQLMQSLTKTQDEASIFQQQNVNLEKENALLKERLKGSEVKTWIKEFFFLFLGIAITLVIEKKPYWAIGFFIVACCDVIILFFIDTRENSKSR